MKTTTNQGNNMNINKYIKEATSKTELLAYKLLLNTQIIEAQRSLDLIELQLHKIELREANDIKKPDHGFNFPFKGRL